MKPPSLPSKPTAPKLPDREYDISQEVAISVRTYSDSLQSIIDAAKIQGIQESDFENLKFETRSGYYDSYDYEFKGKINKHVVLTDAQFRKEMDFYNKKLETYKNKLERYEKLMLEYNNQTFEYEKWEAEQIREKELSLLEKLKKKYNNK